MSTTTYAGQSLKWVRTLLGYPAKYTTAREAYEDALKHSEVETTTKPLLGSVAWFKGGPYGDVGLVVDDWVALRMSSPHPEVDSLRDSSDYLGWSPADVLGEDKGTTMSHIEYGVRVTSDAGHRYLDTTHMTRTRPNGIVAFRNASPGLFPGETSEVVKRQVNYTLGEWEPVDG